MFDVRSFEAKIQMFAFAVWPSIDEHVRVCSMFKKWCSSSFDVRWNGVRPITIYLTLKIPDFYLWIFLKECFFHFANISCQKSHNKVKWNQSNFHFPQLPKLFSSSLSIKKPCDLKSSQIWERILFCKKSGGGILREKSLHVLDGTLKFLGH